MIIQDVNPTKLLTEFNDAGIVITFNIGNIQLDESGKPINHIADLTVEFADGTDMDLVQSIVNAHDPTPIPAPPTPEEKLRLEIARGNAELFEMMITLMMGGE